MMVEFINKPVAVEARTRQSGTLLPLSFVWQERQFKIESWGRESAKEKDGQSVRCHLVQTAGAETWELCWNKKTAQWTLSRHWASKYRIV